MTQLEIEGVALFNLDSYTISVDDRLTDSSGETEAGTKQYDFIRKNIHTITAKCVVTKRWTSRFKSWRMMDKISVKYLDEEGEMSGPSYMRMTSYSTSLITTSNSIVLNEVSFTLEEL